MDRRLMFQRLWWSRAAASPNTSSSSTCQCSSLLAFAWVDDRLKWCCGGRDGWIIEPWQWSYRCSMTSSHTILPTAGDDGNCSPPFALLTTPSTDGRLPILRHWMTKPSSTFILLLFYYTATNQWAKQMAVRCTCRHVSRRLACPPPSSITTLIFSFFRFSKSKARVSDFSPAKSINE